jgi:hypothetical protein
MINILWLIA